MDVWMTVFIEEQLENKFFWNRKISRHGKI